ncbi:YodC family protein [Hymenobacter sp. BT730]|uniref:YodC family protein n=1 Tax=Hymenobacter sp. BT730 TaxID=3063332 RepID=UPI0026E0AA8B|nr:DUF2158 domain-containing protein [Hymenobacter sp. BT730]
MIEERQFLEGDVVRLKSGGPKMTISSVGAGPSANALCIWFDGHNVLQKVSFKVSNLISDDKPS